MHTEIFSFLEEKLLRFVKHLNFTTLKLNLTQNLPKIEKRIAPTKPINGSKFGTAIATAHITKMIAVRNAICVIL